MNTSEKTLRAIASAVLDPCQDLPQVNEVTQCMCMTGPHSFYELYQKIVKFEYCIRKASEIYCILESFPRFECILHGFSKNLQNPDEIRTVDPHFFGPSSSRRALRFCTLRYRRPVKEQLMVDIYRIKSEYKSLQSFRGQVGLKQIVDDIINYTEHAHAVWSLTCFKIPPKVILKRQAEIYEIHHSRGSLDGNYHNRGSTKESKKMKHYGLLYMWSHDRIRRKVVPRSNPFQSIEFGSNADEVRELCA